VEQDPIEDILRLDQKGEEVGAVRTSNGVISGLNSQNKFRDALNFFKKTPAKGGGGVGLSLPIT